MVCVRQDFQAHQRCFIDDQTDLEVLAQDQLLYLVSEKPDHYRPRSARLVDIQLGKKQAVKLQYGAGAGSDMDGPVFRWMELGRHVPERSGLARSYLSGEKRHGPQPDRIVETVMNDRYYRVYVRWGSDRLRSLGTHVEEGVKDRVLGQS